MTLSQIRNQVNSLERKFAKELAVYRLRRIAEEIATDWEISMSEKEQLPQPLPGSPAASPARDTCSRPG